ncbi:S-adenosyl-L-methionine-dependent methyltransferase [Penicillium maclennaniae]|uniref:S-adenosyl-L-methionine-dependent methyltransferase n=1 Tax=Penicillium maclennaniae TaxID=1343394 RepID=UPI002541FFD3|nr:S-adenosyl-L-methionine-dependent methyltransferase [Penicillium maclennaniae]KAJ5668375.1 S-adenosyl-L-methionine-dependent methyltransferase [Penicillium maclennaniae]
MSEQSTTPAPVTKEKTFSSYNKAQGTEYAQLRPDYSAALYQFILQTNTKHLAANSTPSST